MSNLNKIYSNISNMLPELIKDINEIINNSTNNVNIKILGNELIRLITLSMKIKILLNY